MRVRKGMGSERDPVADDAFEWVSTSVDAGEDVVDDDAASACGFCY